MFFVGRGIDYAISLEGSLKLKEISYIHSEAYAAGELKHGTISLIEPGTLVIGVLTQSDLYEKTISNMLECKIRGAYLVGLTTYGKYEIENQVNFAVYVPKIDEHFVGSLAVVPLQLMGYYVSVAKGLDVDKPRKLAKSVTVEKKWVLWYWQVAEYQQNMIGLTRKKDGMKVWLLSGGIIFYILGYYFLRKRMRRDIVKLFKAYMLLMIFLLSLLSEPFMLKYLGGTLRADTLVLWMAGIEAVGVWDEYKRVKNRNKSNHGSGVKKNGKNEKETRI